MAGALTWGPAACGGEGKPPEVAKPPRGVPLDPGGDNSVQAYGEEGGSDDRDRAARTLRAYFAAKAKGAWGRACGRLSTQVREQLAALAARSPKLKGEGCATAAPAIAQSLPVQEPQPEGAVPELRSLRVKGGAAFAIYRAADRFYYVPMAKEGGSWKVATLNGTTLLG